MSPELEEFITDLDLSGVCSVCLSGAPEWQVPTGARNKEMVSAITGVREDKVDDSFIVCSDCLKLVEARNLDELTSVGLAALMQAQANIPNMTKMQIKRMKLQTHLVVRRAFANSLSDIAGEAVRIA